VNVNYCEFRGVFGECVLDFNLSSLLPKMCEIDRLHIYQLGENVDKF
jgi:hypothetical protein